MVSNAQMDDWPDDFQHFSPSMRLRATAIEKAVAAERERCAKIAEQNSEFSIAAAIRAQPTE